MSKEQINRLYKLYLLQWTHPHTIFDAESIEDALALALGKCQSDVPFSSRARFVAQFETELKDGQ